MKPETTPGPRAAEEWCAWLHMIEQTGGEWTKEGLTQIIRQIQNQARAEGYADGYHQEI